MKSLFAKVAIVILPFGTLYAQQVNASNLNQDTACEIAVQTYGPYKDSIINSINHNRTKAIQVYKSLLNSIIDNDDIIISSLMYCDLGKSVLKYDVKAFNDTLKAMTKTMFGDSMKIYKQVVSNIELYNDSINQIKAEYNSKSIKCKTIKLIGNVTSIDGSTISLFGFAVNSNCEGVYNCDDEGTVGALHEQSNIIALNYSQFKKYSGTEVVGERLEIIGYCYSKKKIGTNAFNASVPVYVFEPCKCLPSEKEFNNKIEYYNNKINKYCNKIGFSNLKQLLEFTDFIEDINKKVKEYLSK